MRRDGGVPPAGNASTALAARNVGWADLYEKEEIAARLANLMARAALFSASGAVEPGKVAQLDATQARAEMGDGRTPLIVDVFATWCGPCKLIAPMLDAVASKAGERCRVVKVDSDLEAELSSELRVAGLPTILFFRDGQEVHHVDCCVSVECLRASTGRRWQESA